MHIKYIQILNDFLWEDILDASEDNVIDLNLKPVVSIAPHKRPSFGVPSTFSFVESAKDITALPWVIKGTLWTTVDSGSWLSAWSEWLSSWTLISEGGLRLMATWGWLSDSTAVSETPENYVCEWSHSFMGRDTVEYSTVNSTPREVNLTLRVLMTSFEFTLIKLLCSQLRFLEEVQLD